MRTINFKLFFGFLLIAAIGKAQPKLNKKNGGFEFTIDKELSYTPVKNQFKSSTCWSYSTLSFLESELARMGKPIVDLSEMFVVRNTYSLKGEKYVRMQGTINFGPGSEFHDAIYILREKGLVPDKVFPIQGGSTKPEQQEVDNVLKAMLNEVIKMHDGGKLNANWRRAYEGALDGYFGALPEKFDFDGKTYTPKSFAQSMGLDANDYIEIGSYTHHPFYRPFVLEVSDNWSWGNVYNVPLNEMEQIVENAISNNYTVAWASDVSEFGFSHKNGVAIVPVKDKNDMSQAERDTAFNHPSEEKDITQEMRQAAFDNLSTTDDHGMHIVGAAKDQTGKRYYIVKNSWGTESNDIGGILYVSSSYFKYKTTSILVHKNAIPKDILSKIRFNN